MSKVLSYLERIPLWKRLIPKHPVYFKGDPQRKTFLPLFWMAVIEKPPGMPSDQVCFLVHPQMNKPDIKEYLEKIYNVPVLCVRTEIRENDVKAFAVHEIKGKLANRYKVAREQEKRAYVTLKEGSFDYPEFPITQTRKNINNFEEFIKNKTDDSKALAYMGMPKWFM